MASGILNLAPQKDQVAAYTPTPATASKPEAVSYTAKPFEVTPEQTVSGQVAKLYSDDSPLLQQARVRAKQQAADRGLQSSSIAVGAGEQAVLSQALPIATEDSRRYFDANTNTVNATNAAEYANAQAKNTANLRGSELETNVSLANADAANRADVATTTAANAFKQTDLESQRAYELSDRDTRKAIILAEKDIERALGTANIDANTRVRLAEMDHDTRMELANVDRGTRVELASIENNYRQLLQTNDNLSAMYNQVSNNIANIAASNLSQSAKDAATQSQLDILREALRANQGVIGTPAHTSPTPAGAAPQVQSLNLGQYFSGTQAGRAFNQAGYDKAMQQYNAKVAARDASWKAWDQGGRSGPWDVPAPTKPNRDDFYEGEPKYSF